MAKKTTKTEQAQAQPQFRVVTQEQLIIQSLTTLQQKMDQILVLLATKK